MKKYNETRKITGLAILTALVISLQFLSNYITFGPVSITLSLIPIVIGSIIFGPLAGAFLGFVNGIIVLIAPSTLALFFELHPFPTILICLSKTTIAGAVSGLIFNCLRNKEKLASVLCSISVPIINTGIFSILCLIFFKDLLNSSINNVHPNAYAVLFLGFIGINFIIEFFVNAVLSTAVYSITKYEIIRHKK